MDEARALTAWQDRDGLVADALGRLGAAEAVVNAAGVAEAWSGDTGLLLAANGALPGVLAAAAHIVSARFVHVSSAAVQGRTARLDASDVVRPFSAYSLSKAVGERAAHAAYPESVVYRPPGVHGAGRSVTASLARVASSNASSVAGRGTQNTAQALLPNVADAIAFLALSEQQPPRLVAHPSEGLTTGGLLRVLGAREPRHLPVPLARAAVTLAHTGGRMSPRVAASARRLEVLWFGQEQAPSWLTEAGWKPKEGHEGWRRLRHELNQDDRHEQGRKA
jgi:nucleoside-diphosphate-sugar epimerase